MTPEFALHLCVAHTVLLKLGAPVGQPGLGALSEPAICVLVPEAPVDEHDPAVFEHDIRTPRHVGCACLYPMSKCDQETPHPELGSRPRRPDSSQSATMGIG